MQWITTYWLPLLLSLVIGFILGWLLLGISPRRKAAALEAQLADLEGKARKTERDLGDARKQGDTLKAAVATSETKLNDVSKQLATAQADVAKLNEDKAAADADLQSRNIEAADYKMQLALLQDQYDKARSSTAAEIESLRSQLSAANAQVADLSSARSTAEAELNAVRGNSVNVMESLSNKDAALNEAYTRAVNLQRVLEDREAAVTAAQNELSNLKIEVNALNAVKAELEDRLQRARGDVAGEMAVLTGTMIKMKEEQLTSANARIVELQNEINALRSSQAAG
ncbi:MAG: hypothetical protein IPK16_18885 [Anaerolineales bacterium]|nr:hypothetical protein [Anaerolineales bacterium]